jgi:hypothetical protein
MPRLNFQRLRQVRSNAKGSRDDATGQIAEMLREFKVSKTPTTGSMPALGHTHTLIPKKLW